ncbi:hypothetical protein [Anaerotignum sp. MB30-C6]|uniref:hypothetical protein n=1 Tax=Anaerotignum sp. MB30-C6 TaxID=3070814 RepID=UPI0027DAE69E|nr:hypothetical protein [Anaerotignum sp. MB30-C6]WMI80080.1 hypothetical protein RBQ60_09550 [Anaerotignum sp. MB30-C6]
MKITDKMQSTLIIVSTILWVVCCILAWNERFIEAIWSGILIMAIYLCLGSSKKGVLSKKFFCYPILIWAVLWAVGFWAAQHFAVMFLDIQPTFTILGMHPSFAMVVFCYWFGGVVTISLGFMLLRKEWLSPDEWDDFKKKIEQMKKKQSAGKHSTNVHMNENIANSIGKGGN